jgi:hypothetical protein
MRGLIAVLVGMLATGCVPEREAPGDGLVDGAVRAHVADYYTVLSARDWDVLPDAFWPDATLTTIWQPAGEVSPRVWSTTVAEFIAAAPEGPDSRPVFEERPLSIEPRVEGDIASAWVHYRARFGAPGDLMCWTGIDVFTLLRFNGEWRIASLAYVTDDVDVAPESCA